MNEPATHGRVVLRTNRGDLVIDLWSREAPLACRNFLQLCLEGYYDGTSFNRIIPGFIVQCGDGSSLGREALPAFPDEIHQRLKYRYRGLVGVASSGPGTNGAQFFVTLSKQDMLNGKHTLFGKVTGESGFNIERISSVETDSSDRPTGADGTVPTILSTEVLLNPFPDLKPRVSTFNPVRPSQAAPLRKKQLLSFARDDSESSGSDDLRVVSAHDVLPTLSNKVFVPPTPSALSAPAQAPAPVAAPMQEPVAEPLKPKPVQKARSPIKRVPAKKQKRSEEDILAAMQSFSSKVKAGNSSEWFNSKISFSIDSATAYDLDSSKQH